MLMQYHHDERDKRRLDKTFLKEFYPDYDPTHHDAFVDRYNKNLKEFWEKQYRINRGIEKI